MFSPDGKVRELPSDKSGMIVGLIEDAKYQTASHQIAPGEGLLVYTDGVTEAMDRKRGFLYGEAAAGGAPGAARLRCPWTQLVARLMRSVEEFAAGMPQADDITVLAMRYLGN